MMTRSLITLSIQETAVASRRAFQFQIDLDNRPIVRNQQLSIAETQLLRGLTNQYTSMFNMGSGVARFALEQQRALGVKLFHLWLAPAWERLRTRMHPGMRRTLVIASDVAEILNLPWELLRPPSSDFISFDPAFSIRHCPRSEALLHQAKHTLPAGPLRVLFMACAPSSQSVVDGRREEAALLQAIAQAGPTISMETGVLGTVAELAQQLERFQPHIVHLAGQSQIGHICPACHALSQAADLNCRQCGGLLDGLAAQPYFVFEDERGQPDPRSALELRRLLGGSSVQCVCISSGRKKTPPIAAVGGLCRTLVGQDLPLAVSWACSLDDDVANQFAATLYRQLAQSQPIDDALAQARHAIRSVCDLRGDLGWTLPVLYAATTQALIVAPTPACIAPTIERQQVRQQPLPGLTEGGAASLIARRRSIQHVLPGLRNGSLRTVVLIGESGSGKSVLATSLVHALVEQDFTPIPIVSRPQLPLTAARLFQICANVFTAAGLDVAGSLCDPKLPLRDRLQLLITTLNRGRFVLLLDGFDANLHPQTHMIRRPWLAVLYTHLCYHLSGGSRALLTTRVLPGDLSRLPNTVVVQQVGAIAEAAFLHHMFADVVVERRYQQGELSPHLLREIYQCCGTMPRFLEQIRAALRQLSVEDLRVLLINPVQAAGAELEPASATSPPIAALSDWLYTRLSTASQQALCRAALCDVPADLPMLAALCQLSIDQARAYTQEWHLYGLCVEVGDDLWSVPRALRRWLLMPARFSPEARRAAHGELAAILVALEHESREQVLGLSWFDCVLEARRHYLASGELRQARALTCRISDMLERWGLDDDLEDLNQDLLAYELHPTPMRWIGQTYAMRGDFETARHWFERTLVVAGNRQPAAAADVWRTLAALDLKRGSSRSARLKLENALVLWQQIGDHAGEATTFAQLGVLAAQLGQPEPALRLMALSALLFRRIDHANLRHVKSWMQRLATMLGYSQSQVRGLVRQVIADYRGSHGWSLIHAAFHDAQDQRRYQTRAAA